VSQPIHLKDIKHVIYVAVIVVVVVVAFLLIRAATVPESFGQYGHYRGVSIEERMNLPVVFQTVESCMECHEEENGKWVGYELYDEGKHSVNHCMNCHAKGGPGEKTPCEAGYVIREASHRVKCLWCHNPMVARPSDVAIYDEKKHLEEEDMEKDAKCTECHIPHYPEL
jgi:hypothetical protein